MHLAKTQLICIVCVFIQHAYGTLITADFSQGTDDWNHGQGLWTIQTNANGLASNDPYLYMNPIGTAPRRGIIVWNENPNWTGNYTTKGVTSINFYARNASLSEPLYFRVAIGNTRNPMSGTWFVSDSLSYLQYDDGWQMLNFDLNSNSMVLASSAMASGSPGTDSFNDVFSNVAALRIISQGSAFSATAQDHYGDAYIDSIALVPEPQTVGLIVLSTLILIMIRGTHEAKTYVNSEKITVSSSIIGDSFNKKTPFL